MNWRSSLPTAGPGISTVRAAGCGSCIPTSVTRSGWYEGNADAIYSNREVIADHDPDVLLVLSADHVYKLDYSDVIAHHLDSGAA